ncbi:MAG TPA: MCE family protein [Nocardioidaceae bacterium]|nr:MCE family protein [Nocardioidaceae bacterium]
MKKIQNLPRAIIALVVVLLAMGALVFVRGDEQRTVVAHFSRAVSLFPGSEVRILGVRVGEVVSVIPEGTSVRVEMVYDAEYPVPADAQAVIITPTLTADRFVQLTPAYDGSGPVLDDGGEIAVQDTGVPVELDRIYRSLSDLTEALGPNGVNKNGTLNNVLEAGTKFLDGEGRRANATIINLSRAVKTFGDGSGDLFGAVAALNEFAGELAANDSAISAFMQNLGTVSQQLAGEKDELYGALKNLADVLGKIEGFVKGNRALLTSSVRDLGRIMRTIAGEKTALEAVLEIGPVAMGNLVTAWDPVTSTIGSRINVGNNFFTLDEFVCQALVSAKLPVADAGCDLIRQLLGPALRGARTSGKQATATQQQPAGPRYGTAPAASDLTELMGGGS